MNAPARAIVVGLAGLLALAAGASAAEPPRLSVRTEPRGRVSDTEPFRLLIQVEGEGSGEASIGALPPMKQIRVMSGPFISQSSSFTFDASGAHRSSSVLFVYTLLADGPGETEIPAIPVKIGSTTYKTDPIGLSVVAGSAGPPGARPPARGAPRPARPEAGAEADVFLDARLASTEVWAGQPVVLDVDLVTAERISQFGWESVPSFSNFWTEDVEVDAEAEQHRERFGDREYVVYPIVRKILVPTSAGETTIEPFTAQMQVRARARDFFSDMLSMGGGLRTTVRKTKPLSLRVKALPEAGRPASFGGAVGSFRMKVEMDRQQARVNDAVALRVTVEGDGSLQSVPPPRLEASTEFKLFEPKVTTTTRTGSGRLVSKKVWEWVVVPLTPGTIRMPAVRFGAFDPTTGRYVDLAQDPGTLAVVRGEGPVDTATARSDVRLERQEIRFIKQRKGDLAVAHRPFHRSGTFAALVALPLVAGPALVVWGRRRARLRQDRGFARAHRAAARARRRLKAASKRIAEPGTAFHDTVASTLVEFVADRFDRSASGLTYDVVESLLEQRGVDGDLRRRLRSLLESCDFARYVPDAASRERRDALAVEAGAILDALERVS